MVTAPCSPAYKVLGERKLDKEGGAEEKGRQQTEGEKSDLLKAELGAVEKNTKSMQHVSQHILYVSD